MFKGGAIIPINRRGFSLGILGLLISITVFSQQPASDLTSVDSFARTVRYGGNLDSLADGLTARYSEQICKVRSIFIWITENIRYDYKSYNRYLFRDRDPVTYKCRDDEDCAAKRMAWETKFIDNVLRRKKALCEGYSLLFKRMCDIAGLKAVVIPGYIRTEPYQVGTPGTLDHQWNAVWIDSAYYLLDLTWAAGGCLKDADGRMLGFVKQLNDYYWLTPPSDFVRNHYPRDSIWTLIPGYSREMFAANPWYDRSELSSIELIRPASGIIRAKKGDTIHFKLRYPRRIGDLQINSNVFRNPDIIDEVRVSRWRTDSRLNTRALEMQQYIAYRRDGTRLEFEYVVKEESLDYLEILFDRRPVMRFDVVVR